ncbi:uncharacterized protein EI90DRAFT_3128195 [Cantharellus anzutake]|uniref:uncharacterized protein n=1 Tax=Cantharellus anzutake TaxID=1750568 RepID=UPI001908CF76|nr:uncharacterized protein EI90DRAFT_3128195 [Cantharellus anzutake]KAF8326048.1 hypothetical protein EI90DRAFT_3128195 [Cantharellus anzutake]
MAVFVFVARNGAFFDKSSKFHVWFQGWFTSEASLAGIAPHDRFVPQLASSNLAYNMPAQILSCSILGDITAASLEDKPQVKPGCSASFTDGMDVLDFIDELRSMLHTIDNHAATPDKASIQYCLELDEAEAQDEEDITEGWVHGRPQRFEPPPSYQDIYSEDDECPFSDEELDRPVSMLSRRAMYWACRRSDRIRDAARARPVPASIPLSEFEDPESPIRPSAHALGRRSHLHQSWTMEDLEDYEPDSEIESDASSEPSMQWSDDEELEEPAALLDFFASCTKVIRIDLADRSDSEDDDSLDTIEEGEELEDVGDLMEYFKSCKPS